MNNNIKSVLIIIISSLAFMLVMGLILLGITFLFSVISPSSTIAGSGKYDKQYYINEYNGDLDSNLLIFPKKDTYYISNEYYSSFETNLFDTDGYIILKAKYDKKEFDNEINRIKSLNMTIKNGCKKGSNTYKNKIKYDEKSYNYPAYITIDGFDSTYEYALINNKESEIIYVYLSYPNLKEQIYKEYLKKDKSEYSNVEKASGYSMYNHSFDSGKSFAEFDDCQ